MFRSGTTRPVPSNLKRATMSNAQSLLIGAVFAVPLIAGAIYLSQEHDEAKPATTQTSQPQTYWILLEAKRYGHRFTLAEKPNHFGEKSECEEEKWRRINAAIAAKTRGPQYRCKRVDKP